MSAAIVGDPFVGEIGSALVGELCEDGIANPALARRQGRQLELTVTIALEREPFAPEP